MFFTAQTGAVKSRCCIEAVANAENWSKGGANYTEINTCIRTEQFSRMFEAQDSRKKLYYNVLGLCVRWGFPALKPNSSGKL